MSLRAAPGAVPIARRLGRREPIAYVIALSSWVAFNILPIPAGLVLKAVLDRVSDDAASPVLGLLVFLAVIEVGRWAVFWFAVVQWHGVWVVWNTLPRLNMLRSLVDRPGPASGRLPGSTGEAVSRFRDDAMHLSMVLDVWLDMTGVGDHQRPRGARDGGRRRAGDADRGRAGPAGPGALPHARQQLRAWRRPEREATAEVTGRLAEDDLREEIIRAAH